MEYTRWYDKDINLKALMQLLESLSDEEKLIITSDILQVLMMNYSPDTDNLIEELDGQYIPVRRRWYDKFETLHSAVEILRITDLQKRREIINEIFQTVLESISENKNDNLRG